MNEDIDSYDSELDKTIKGALNFVAHALPRVQNKFSNSTYDKDSRTSD